MVEESRYINGMLLNCIVVLLLCRIGTEDSCSIVVLMLCRIGTQDSCSIVVSDSLRGAEICEILVVFVDFRIVEL